MTVQNYAYPTGKAPLETLPRELYLNIIDLLETKIKKDELAKIIVKSQPNHGEDKMEYNKSEINAKIDSEAEEERLGRLTAPQQLDALNSLARTSKTLYSATIPSLYQDSPVNPRPTFNETVTINCGLAQHVHRLSIGKEPDDAVLLMCCTNVKELALHLLQHTTELDGETKYHGNRPAAWSIGNLMQLAAFQKDMSATLLKALTSIKIFSTIVHEAEPFHKVALDKVIQNSFRISTVRRLYIDLISIPNLTTTISNEKLSQVQELTVRSKYLETEHVQYFLGRCMSLHKFSLVLWSPETEFETNRDEDYLWLDLPPIIESLRKHETSIKELKIDMADTRQLYPYDIKQISTLNTFLQLTTLVLTDFMLLSNLQAWEGVFIARLPPLLKEFTIYTEEHSPRALEILGQLILADPPKSLATFVIYHTDSWSAVDEFRLLDVTSGHFTVLSSTDRTKFITTQFNEIVEILKTGAPGGFVADSDCWPFDIHWRRGRNYKISHSVQSLISNSEIMREIMPLVKIHDNEPEGYQIQHAMGHF